MLQCALAFKRRLPTGCLIAVVLAMGITGWPALGKTDTNNACERFFPRYERKFSIPMYLLHAIGQTESGTQIKGHHEKVAWPWTVQMDGEGHFFPTKKEAVAFVEGMMAQGKQNMDVGCMQVNMYYHGNAFRSVADAFDPSQNIAYAANYLKEQYQKYGHWRDAAAAYHSQTPKHGKRYAHKVITHWAQLMQGLHKNPTEPANPDTHHLALPATPVALWQEVPRHTARLSAKEERTRQANSIIMVNTPQAQAEPTSTAVETAHPAPEAHTEIDKPKAAISEAQLAAATTLDLEKTSVSLNPSAQPDAKTNELQRSSQPEQPVEASGKAHTPPSQPTAESIDTARQRAPLPKDMPVIASAQQVKGVWQLAQERQNQRIAQEKIQAGKREKEGVTLIFAY